MEAAEANCEVPVGVCQALVADVDDVADVLAAAHRLGIVHRDIKPDNILLARGQSDSDMVKVADFGIAKVMEGTLDVGSGCASTRSGMIVGTPQYLSPEQAIGNQGNQIDGRADLYSLGIVLYMMLTGKLPFESDTPMGFLVHHLQTQPVPLEVMRPDLDIPSPLSQVLMKSLEKDREKRFADADAMKEALQFVLEPARGRTVPRVRMAATPTGSELREQMAEAPAAVQRPVEKPPTSSKEPIRRRRPVAPWIATGSLLLVAGIFAAARFRGLLVGKSRNQTLTTLVQRTAVVTVVTSPSGALVWADNKLMGSSGAADGRLPLSLVSGGHSLRVSLHGFRDWEKTITLSPGDTAQFAVTLEPLAPARVDRPHPPGQSANKHPSGQENAGRALSVNGTTHLGGVPAVGADVTASSILAESQTTKPQSQTSASVTAQEHLTSGSQMMQRKEWNGAVSEFRAAVQLLPNNSMAHNNLEIAIEMSKGEQRAALEEYRKAHELDPRNSSAKANYERLRMDLAH